MMTASEITCLIRDHIRDIHSLPYTYVGDLGELDGVMFQLHWLYAHATGRISDFIDAAKSESRDEFVRYNELTQSHEPVCASGATQEILERWKARGQFIGLTP
jgi:hypothetical protein